MKKISIVLLMVLVAGFAFASFKGDASISFGYNLDTTDWGFKNAKNTEYSFTFEFDTANGSSTGEGKLYAEIAGTAKANLVWNKVKNANNAATANAALSITKANVVYVYEEGSNVVFDILGPGKGVTYAKRFAKLDGTEDTIKDLSAGVEGFNVSHCGWTLGIGAEGNVDAEKYTIFTALQTKEFKFSEDAVSVKASAFAKLVEDETKNVFGGAVKAGYKSDKFTANAAFDAKYENEKFLFEAAADAKYDFVTLKVYATPGALFNSTTYVGDKAEAIKLDAEVAASKEFGEETKVKVNATVGTRDALIENIYLYAKADASTTIDAFTFAAGAEYGFNLLDEPAKKSDLTANASVKYAAEKFTATAKVTAKFDLTADEALTSLVPELTVESTKLIDNATLTFTWKGADFAVEDTLGALTASCKVAF